MTTPHMSFGCDRRRGGVWGGVADAVELGVCCIGRHLLVVGAMARHLRFVLVPMTPTSKFRTNTNKDKTEDCAYRPSATG